MKSQAQCPRCQLRYRVYVPAIGIYQTQCPDCDRWFQFEAKE